MRLARETVRHAGPDARQVLAEDGDECIVCVALVKEHGQSRFDGEFELQPEDALLVLVRREIAEIVEPAFAGGADPGFVHQAAQFRHVRGVELARVMRVDAGRRAESPGIAAHDRDGGARAFERAAGDDHVADTGGHGRGHDGVPVVVEAVVGEVEADVYEGQDHARNAVLRFAASQRWSAIAPRQAF